MGDGREAGRGAGNLDHRVGTGHRSPQAFRFVDRAIGVACERGRYLQGHEPIGAGGLLIERREGVACGPDVGHGHRLEDLAGTAALIRQAADVLVIKPAAGDRLLEDRGVRGHAAEPVVGNQPSELA